MTNTNQIDKENLRQIILDFPRQFKKGFEIAQDIKLEGNFKSLIVSGMGGSSLPADILRLYLESLGISLSVTQNRTYSLPQEAHHNALNFFLSYSGNTEETIASFEEALKNNLLSIGFATGGKLIEICQKNNIPYVVLPSGIQPRYATGYFFASMLKVLANCGIAEFDFEKISGLAEDLLSRIENLEKKGKEIAKNLKGKTPIIYTTEKFKALAMILKIKINENAKTPAFYNFFPELNHNEMVGFTLPQAQFHILTFIDNNEHPQNIKRMHITAQLYKEKGIDTTTIEMEKEDIFMTIFSTLVLGDWISYYLALEYGQDPTPVKMVEDLKKQLA